MSCSFKRNTCWGTCLNAAPEWQAKTQVLKQETGGGLSTQGACYTDHCKTPLPTSNSSNLAPLVTHLDLTDSYIGSDGKAMTLFAPNHCVSFTIAFVLRICVNNIASLTLGREQAT